MSLKMRNNNTSNRNNNNQGNSSGSQSRHSSNQPNEGRKHQHQNQSNPSQSYAGQRERSGQRNQSGQYPDSSMNRDNSNSQSNLGSIRFAPGQPTRDLPPIETKADPHKKFTGRCRLFVGNLPHNTSEEKLKTLFERFGEVGEVFLGPKSAFAFVKMDTRQNAEAARDALDCSTYEGRALRVRLAAHAAAIRVKHLSTQVTNELLAYAFRYFGEIERAVIVVDDKGKSIGEGVVEYSRKQSALYAMKRCQQECFMLTASPKPVLVEPFDQRDEDEGLPEKSINKNSIEFKEQRDVGPRFAEQGTFEHDFSLKWKELYELEKKKRDILEQEIQDARKNLQEQIEYSRLEHDTMQLRNRLQQLEDNRMKLQQMKEQTMSGAQQRDEERRQQDMLIRQREEDILRRQQLGDPNGLNQQESALRMQANALQDILSNQDQASQPETSQSQQKSQTPITTGQINHEPESGMPIPPLINHMGMMAPQMPNQARNYADVAMMGMNQPFMQVPQMNMNQANQPNMFTAFIPQQQMQMQPDTSNNPTYAPMQARFNMPQQQSSGRQQKYRQYNQSGDNMSDAPTSNDRRPRKRGRY